MIVYFHTNKNLQENQCYIYTGTCGIYIIPHLYLLNKKNKQTEETTQLLFMFYMHNVQWTM